MTFRVCFKIHYSVGTLTGSGMARSTMRAACPTGIHRDVAQPALAAGHMSLRFRMEMMIQWAVPSIVDLWHKLFRKWDAGFRV